MPAPRTQAQGSFEHGPVEHGPFEQRAVEHRLVKPRRAERVARHSAGRSVIATLAALAMIVSFAPAAAAGPAGTASAVTAPSSRAVAIPAVGSHTASPATDITLRGVQPAQVDGLTVTGSRSGSYELQPTALPRDLGVTIHPAKPFRPGETVTVRTSHPISGLTDNACGCYTFTVGRPGADFRVKPNGDVVATSTLAKQPHTGQPNTGPTRPNADQTPMAQPAAQHFVTRPDLVPPTVTIEPGTGSTSPGLLFASANYNGTTGSQNGMLIYNNTGRTVWFNPIPAGTAGLNLAPVTYLGKSALAWFEGAGIYGQAGRYWGEWVVVDSSYTEIARLRMGNGYQADTHDLVFSDHGTVYLEGYNPLQCDGVWTSGCTSGTVLEAVIQEIDLATGAVLWEWHSLDAGHIPLSDSYSSAPSGNSVWDYIHLNSLDIDSDGYLLASARITSALYKINPVTGAVVWIVGGKSNQFTYVGEEYGTQQNPGPSYPHDISSLGGGSYSYFDNGVQRAAFSDSRGAVFALDLNAKTATYTRIVHHTPPIHEGTQGRAEVLPDQHMVIGWGGSGVVTEYDAADNEIFEADINAGSYRQERAPWTGAPAAAPDVKVTGSGSSTVVNVSWNGDSRTASWQVLSGTGPGSLKPAGSKPVTSFETRVAVTSPGQWYAVQALDVNGKAVPGGRTSAQRLGNWFTQLTAPPVSGSYRPIVGDFAGGHNDDILYYAPGTATDYLHIANVVGGFTSVVLPAVNGSYTPLVGNFAGDERDEVLWWAPGQPIAYLWRLDINPRGQSVVVRSAGVAVPTTAQPVVLHNRPNYGGGTTRSFGTGPAVPPTASTTTPGPDPCRAWPACR